MASPHPLAGWRLPRTRESSARRAGLRSTEWRRTRAGSGCLDQSIRALGACCGKREADRQRPRPAARECDRADEIKGRPSELLRRRSVTDRLNDSYESDSHDLDRGKLRVRKSPPRQPTARARTAIWCWRDSRRTSSTVPRPALVSARVRGASGRSGLLCARGKPATAAFRPQHAASPKPHSIWRRGPADAGSGAG